MKEVELVYRDAEGTTKMIMVDLKTGEFKTIDSEVLMFVAHFSQSYETKDGEIVVEQPYTETANAFIDLLLRKNYDRIDKMSSLNLKGKFKRCTFNFDKGTVQIKDLHAMDFGVVDLP
jgi:carotenoid cleavage dioxygenase-like enzyme